MGVGEKLALNRAIYEESKHTLVGVWAQECSERGLTLDSYQGPRIVHATKQYEKAVSKLKFLHTWIKGKHIVNEPTEKASDSILGNAEKKDA
ncbi:hypothetical protein J1N35_044468 [Gossypium stocksii]|uniref:Uncharacterized protein n=1 Tax=Gossypium stocksii TaxID=47602 RepID=A0A9D3U9G1_9ROSI|nr:hypothetical protein J1N35_044468 [Gossypium stocksii]